MANILHKATYDMKHETSNSILAGKKAKHMNPTADLYVSLGLVDDKSGKRVERSTPRVVLLLSCVLEKSIQKNHKLLEGSKRNKDAVTIFHGSKAPDLSIRDYMRRIFKYVGCSNSCFVSAYIYIDRFLQRKGAYLTSLNAHRLLITGVMVAAKFMDDECHNNAYYAKVGGVSTEEMNGMEIEFLFNLDFRLHVTPDMFRKYCMKLEKEGTVDFPIDRPVIDNRRRG